jgi:hypothetical protein
MVVSGCESRGFWREAFRDQDFEKQVERVCVRYIPEFGIAATVMQLREHSTGFVLDVSSEDGEAPRHDGCDGVLRAKALILPNDHSTFKIGCGLLMSFTMLLTASSAHSGYLRVTQLLLMIGNVGREGARRIFQNLSTP